MYSNENNQSPSPVARAPLPLQPYGGRFMGNRPSLEWEERSIKTAWKLTMPCLVSLTEKGLFIFRFGCKRRTWTGFYPPFLHPLATKNSIWLHGSLVWLTFPSPNHPRFGFVLETSLITYGPVRSSLPWLELLLPHSYG